MDTSKFALQCSDFAVPSLHACRPMQHSYLSFVELEGVLPGPWLVRCKLIRCKLSRFKLIACFLQHNRDKPALTLTTPEVLECLATHLIKHDPTTAHALHCTSRAAAAAVQDAMTSLSVTGRHADLAHTALAFPGLSNLKYTQCAVLVEVCTCMCVT